MFKSIPMDKILKCCESMGLSLESNDWDNVSCFASNDSTGLVLRCHNDNLLDSYVEIYCYDEPNSIKDIEKITEKMFDIKNKLESLSK